jgi:hypothetical protein
MPNISAPNLIKHEILNLKPQTNPNTMIRDFNTPLSPIDRASRQNKQTNKQKNHKAPDTGGSCLFRILGGPEFNP